MAEPAENPLVIFFDPRCAEYGSRGHPEQPARATATAAHLRAARPAWSWAGVPESVPDETLLLAHTPGHLARLSEPQDFDPDTAYFPNIGARARGAVAAALAASQHAMTRHSPAFSLMRPPGHHATADTAMGFCYLNQIAITALAARKTLENYPLLPSARGELLRRLGRTEEAKGAYAKAVALSRLDPERRFYARRLAELE